MVNVAKSPHNNLNVSHCQYFVTRKKRLCRMTVRPGRQYCGEHEPHPEAKDGKTDERIPCPNDPKHTVYVSKLEKHLAVCNARPVELPPYVVMNVNAPAEVEPCPRTPLSEISKETLTLVVNKINALYDMHVKGNISTLPERGVHAAVAREFAEGHRGEGSRRHLRQASQLLRLAEDEGLVRDGTCYLELGAGKGQLSYYCGVSWCGGGGGSRVVAVDRASLRHKRDNRLRDAASVRVRVRADLAHLALHRVPAAQRARRVLALAKHLCGVATDYALRCITAEGVVSRCSGAVVATCCHHRCERAAYVATDQLQELGVTGEDLNAMLGIVSWATCGTGRSRDRRQRDRDAAAAADAADADGNATGSDAANGNATGSEATGDDGTELDSRSDSDNLNSSHSHSHEDLEGTSGSACRAPGGASDSRSEEQSRESVPPHEVRERVGRKAKAILDWGRVLYLRGKGFEARLCYYVPTSVSLENICIVAKKNITDDHCDNTSSST